MQECRLEGQRQLWFYFAVAYCLHLVNKKRRKQPLKVKLLFQGWRKWRLYQTHLQIFLLILGVFFLLLMGNRTIVFFAFISVSPVVRNYYSGDRQWKLHKLELSSLSWDQECFSIWFSSLLDQSRSFMWDGDSNKVVALKEMFLCKCKFFWLLEKYGTEMRLEHSYSASRRESEVQGRVHHMWAECEGHNFIQFALTLVLREQWVILAVFS